MFAVYKLKGEQDEKYEAWDNETCTPADYSMLVRLSKD